MNFGPGSRASVTRLALLAVLLLAGRDVTATLPITATGANVDESRVTQILYVDPAHTEAADDDKHGLADLPFATFNYACQTAAKAKDANVGVKIVLAAGTYRETGIIPAPPDGKPDTDAPLVIEAAEREQAVIDGAETEGWSPSTWKAEGARWTHPWPFRRNAPAHPVPTSESYRRGALVFVNGVLLRQVNAVAELAPGCFWEPVPIAAGGRKKTAAGGGNEPLLAVVEPPPDTELPGAILQVGVRSRGLLINGRRNVVVRGLLIQHAAAPTGEGEKTAGLVLEGCSNVLVEDALCQWNDGSGLEILGRAGGPASEDYTLRRVRLLHNGGSGFHVANLKNLLAEDCETSFNNFRGDWAGWIDPQGPAGGKIEEVRGSTWRRQHVVSNACRGLWWAGGNTDVAVEDTVVRDNFITGICIENDPGPVQLRRCLVAGTKGPPSAGGNAVGCAGMSLSGTPDVTLESNVVADNSGTQLSLGESSPKPITRDERQSYHHNVFYSADPEKSLCRMPVANNEPKPEADAIHPEPDSRENCFWNPAKAEVLVSYIYSAATRKAGALCTSRGFNLEGWQTTLQKEAGSLWQDPLFVAPAEGDYRLKATSPVKDWDLPSDEGSAGQ